MALGMFTVKLWTHSTRDHSSHLWGWILYGHLRALGFVVDIGDLVVLALQWVPETLMIGMGTKGYMLLTHSEICVVNA